MSDFSIANLMNPTPEFFRQELPRTIRLAVDEGSSMVLLELTPHSALLLAKELELANEYTPADVRDDLKRESEE